MFQQAPGPFLPSPTAAPRAFNPPCEHQHRSRCDRRVSAYGGFAFSLGRDRLRGCKTRSMAPVPIRRVTLIAEPSDESAGFNWRCCR
ncbi:hypothetical protein QL093DRAFT_2159169 [Fusarium oxysporum]|nr:hypothetical protein QL093DRAFT_2159169 [Fusarium oxysporum]